ncbi:MAG: hypothetical protein U0359_18130 [Byssovorax sp.]
MRIKRWAIVSAVVVLDIVACTTVGTIPGSTTTSSTTATGTTTGAGGLDPAACMGFVDVYDFCGDCRLCLQELCCAELLTCTAIPGCINCVANDPHETPACYSEAVGAVLTCSQNCERCHPNPFDSPAPLDCSPNYAKKEGGEGGTGGAM